MNEFVARKGLISLKSSSFSETLYVGGNISSPVEAFVTSSWALNSETASYVDAPFFTLQAIATSSVNTSPINSLVKLSSFVESKTTNAVTWPFVTSSLTEMSYGCTRDGWYDLEFECQLSKSTGASSVGGIAIVVDDIIENGTYKVQTIISNATEYGLSSKVRKFVSSGSIVYPSIVGKVTTISTVIPTKIVTGMNDVGGPKFTISLVK